MGFQGQQVIPSCPGLDGGPEPVPLVWPEPGRLVDDDAGRGLVHVPLVLVQDPAHQAGGVIGGKVRRPAAGLVGVPVEVVSAQDQALAVLVKRLHEAGLHRGEAAAQRR